MAGELLFLHAQAMFLYGADGDMTCVNEPWDRKAPAPRAFLVRGVDGGELLRFRGDVPPEARGRIRALCAAFPRAPGNPIPDGALTARIALLLGGGCEAEACYAPAGPLAEGAGCVLLQREDLKAVTNRGFSWLSQELPMASPCAAALEGGQAVSVCRSVRITARAHEAGIETLRDCRRRGHARAAFLTWAAAVRARGALPLYSALLENTASRSLAESCGLTQYGVGVSFY